MTRSELAMGLVTFIVVIAAGLLSARYVDRHFAAAELDKEQPAASGACVDEDGAWKNWSFPNVPALSPKCAEDR